MGQPFRPQQLDIVDPQTATGNYQVVLAANTAKRGLVVCGHTTWIAAWKCVHGNCTKGHNFNERTEGSGSSDRRWRVATDDGSEV